MPSRIWGCGTSTCRCCPPVSGRPCRRLSNDEAASLVGLSRLVRIRMTDAILAEAADRAARNEAFVLATVVWRRAPSSGQVGSRALVFGDGAMRGWLGGACAQPTVRREALTAMQDGRSRLILLGIPPEAADAFGEGAVVKPMACGSEGALAVYVEPFVPVAVVVATQGEADEEALEAALRTSAGYVGLVASRKRADATLGYLRDRGVPEADLARVQGPGCLQAFSADPGSFVSVPASASSGTGEESHRHEA